MVSFWLPESEEGYEICGWTKSCNYGKLGKPLFVGMYRGIESFQGFSGYSELVFVQPHIFLRSHSRMADETEAVTEVEKKAISSSFRAKMQAISGV